MVIGRMVIGRVEAITSKDGDWRQKLLLGY